MKSVVRTIGKGLLGLSGVLALAASARDALAQSQVQGDTSTATSSKGWTPARRPLSRELAPQPAPRDVAPSVAGPVFQTPVIPPQPLVISTPIAPMPVVQQPTVQRPVFETPVTERAVAEQVADDVTINEDSNILLVGGEFTPQWQRKPGYRMKPRSRAKAQMAAHTFPFVEDEIVPQPMPDNSLPSPDGDSDVIMDDDGPYMDGGYSDSFGPGPVGPFACDPWGRRIPIDPTCYERFHVCSWLSILNESSIFLGTQAFKGPIDQGSNGNFGFHQGVNLADAIWHRHGLGYQVGGQYIESDLQGNGVAGTGSTGARHQTFVTAGLFHRAFYNRGLQGGVVVDYLNDNYYVNSNLTQVRSEISVLGPCGHEFGFWGAFATRTNGVLIAPANNQQFQPIDQYAFFYRRTSPIGAQGRLWAGFTGPVVGSTTVGQSAGLFGGDFRLPLSNKWDVVGGFNYLIPTQGGVGGGTTEAFGMTMSLVWYPGRCQQGIHNGPYRPLFNVADNNTFILDQRPVSP